MTVSPMLERDDESIRVRATEVSMTATPWESRPNSGFDSVFFSINLQLAQASICAVLSKTEAVAIARALMEAAE